MFGVSGRPYRMLGRATSKMRLLDYTLLTNTRSFVGLGSRIFWGRMAQSLENCSLVIEPNHLTR
jgi:hypothetical protein